MSDHSITSLIEKLEGAEVGSRELDVAIWAHLHPDKLKVTEFWPAYVNHSLTAFAFTLPPKRTRIVTRDKGEYVHAQPVTTSLDAALALAERVLLGVSPGVSKNVFHAYWSAWLHQNVDGACHLIGDASTSRTPALALCAAVLRAQSEARV